MNNRVNELFDQMSREEFKGLLESVGFKVTDGKGEIIYTDTVKEIRWEESNDKYFSLNTENHYRVDGEPVFKASYSPAC